MDRGGGRGRSIFCLRFLRAALLCQKVDEESETDESEKVDEADEESETDKPEKAD